MIAYDVLRRLDAAQVEIPLFITIGSPLGLQEVQDALRQWTGGNLLFPPCVKRWVNIADRLDPVAFDNDISNDFEGKIDNVSRWFLNTDSPRHPHSATGYLVTKDVKDAVRKVIGTTFEQALGLVHDRQGSGRRPRERPPQRPSPDADTVGEGGPGQCRQSGRDEPARQSSVRARITGIIEDGGGTAADAEFDNLSPLRISAVDPHGSRGPCGRSRS